MAERTLAAFAALSLVLAPRPGAAQTVAQRGYIETAVVGHAEAVAGDTQVLGESYVRWEPAVRMGPWRVAAALDARLDSHARTERSAAPTFWDRTIKRPALAVGRLSASWAHGPVTVEIGKQFVRWGKTDILVPTDRFAPRDYLDGVDAELIGVTAARLTVASTSDAFEVVLTPRLTPSRAPLLDQRWAALPSGVPAVPIEDLGAEVPAGPQIGVRWNHVGSALEYSLSFFEGFHHLPWFDVALTPAPLQATVRRRYGQLTAAGADLAAPLPWFTAKAEAAWLDSETPEAGAYVLYVLQLERQMGEWLLIGGYAGEHEIREGTPFRFSPDRGLTRAFIGRAAYTIDTNRSVAIEGVVRQDGAGFYGRVEYSHGLARHWRVVASLTGFGGDPDDFLGRYRRNGFARLSVRYSF